MFQIERTGRGGSGVNRVFDYERDVSVRFVTGHGPQPGSGMLMVWKGRNLPFDVYTDELVDKATSETYYLNKLGTLGASLAVLNREHIRGDPLPEDERAQGVRLAVEAMLVFGGFYDGLEKENGRYRVLLNGVELQLSDFGIKGSGG